LYLAQGTEQLPPTSQVSGLNTVVGMDIQLQVQC